MGCDDQEKHSGIPIYGCQLWSRLFKYSNRKLLVAYNDAFRQLLREPRWCSASRLFVYNNVPSFDAVVRKLVYSFGALYANLTIC